MARHTALGAKKDLPESPQQFPGIALLTLECLTKSYGNKLGLVQVNKQDN